MKISQIVDLVIEKIKKKYPEIKLENYLSNIPLITIEINNAQNIKLEDLKPFEDEINEELKENNDNKGDCCLNLPNFKKLEITEIQKNDKKENKKLKIFYFKNNAEYSQYKSLSEQKEHNDHRGIGKKLDIFSFDPLVGSGMPIWLEQGTKLKKEITKFINKLQEENEIKLICTPELGSKQLYITSGHFEHYKENIFPAISLENNEYILRPMTCPHHILIFKKNKYHINQLPIKIGENAKLFRYEHSGGLFGLERVRSMELIDTHVFCAVSQIKKTIMWAYLMIKNVIEAFDIKLNSIVLSIKDDKNTKKFFKDDELWNTAEIQLKNSLDELKIKYEMGVGDAAFYGPKIDFQIQTYTGKIITLSTIQLDFLLPKRFELSFKNKDQEDETPVMIHIGIIGTLERFTAYLLERNSGLLPVWLSPVQIVIIPIISNLHGRYAQELSKRLNDEDFRVEIDLGEERLNKKIRNAQIRKIPYQIVIGDREQADPKFIYYKKYGVNEKEEKILLDDFITYLKNESKMPKINKSNISWN